MRRWRYGRDGTHRAEKGESRGQAPGINCYAVFVRRRRDRSCRLVNLGADQTRLCIQSNSARSVYDRNFGQARCRGPSDFRTGVRALALNDPAQSPLLLSGSRLARCHGTFKRPAHIAPMSPPKALPLLCRLNGQPGAGSSRFMQADSMTDVPWTARGSCRRTQQRGLVPVTVQLRDSVAVL